MPSMIFAAIVALAVLTAVLITLSIRRGDFRYRDVLLFAVACTIPLRGEAILTFAGGNVRLGDLFLMLAIEAAALEWWIVDRRVRLSRIDVLLVVFIFWCFCTLAWSLDRSFGVTRAITYVRDLLLFAVFAFWSRDRFVQAFRAVSAGVLGSFVYLFANLALRLIGSDVVLNLASGNPRDLARFRGDAGIGGLTFTEGTVLTLSFWTSVAIFFWLARGGCMSVRRTGRILFVVVLVALIALELATFARGGWLGLAVGVACWVIWIGPELRRRLLVPAVVLVVAAILATCKLNLAHIVVRRFESFIAVSGDKAFDERYEYWRRSLDALERHPMGLGLGGTNVVLQRRGIWFVHNLYLQLLAELGPIGLGLVLGVVALALEQAIRGARALDDWPARIAAASLAAAIVAYLVMGTTYFDFADLVIWLLIALASAVPRPHA